MDIHDVGYIIRLWKGTMMTCKEREILEQEMKQEAYEQSTLDYELAKDYDYFLEYYQESLNNCLCAMRHLKDLHYQHNHAWDVLEIEDLLHG